MFDERYAALRAAQTPKADDGAAFDDHLFACFLAIGLTEEEAGVATLTDALGLSGNELARLFATRFPLGALPFPLWREGEPVLEDEETLLRELLSSHRVRDDEAAAWLVAILARRSMRDDHLWQDLGLFNRAELSAAAGAALPGAARRQRQRHALEEILLSPHLRPRRLQPVRRAALLGLQGLRLLLRRRGRHEPPRPDEPGAERGLSPPRERGALERESRRKSPIFR